MITRRNLLIGLGAGAFGAQWRSYGQQPLKSARIGYLGATSAENYARQVAALRAGLTELGYIEGKSYAIEFRWAEGNYALLPALAAELVSLDVDIIVTSGRAALAAKAATTKIPVVVAATGDPVASGLVASLSRPGGNVTGLSFFAPELMAKRLEIVKDTLPGLRRVALLQNAIGPTNKGTLQAMATSAALLKLELHPYEVRGPAEFGPAFAEMRTKRVEAVVIADDTMLVANSAAAAGLATGHRIASIGSVEIAEGGGLIAYAVNFPPMYRRAAVMVDKILKGADPGELPIERATRFDFVINQKTARALGITIPASVLVRADRIIQ